MRCAENAEVGVWVGPAHREVDGEALKVFGKVGARGAVAHKAEACVRRQPLKHTLQRLQVLLCATTTHSTATSTSDSNPLPGLKSTAFSWPLIT